MRKLRIRKVPKDPISEVHESDEHEIPAEDGRPVIFVLRLPPTPGHHTIAHIRDLREMMSERMDRPFVIVALDKDEEFEVWEIED